MTRMADEQPPDPPPSQEFIIKEQRATIARLEQELGQQAMATSRVIRSFAMAAFLPIFTIGAIWYLGLL